MSTTPLETVIGISQVRVELRGLLEFILADLALLTALALRRRKWFITSTGFLWVGLGLMLDLIASLQWVRAEARAPVAAVAIVLFFCGLVRVFMDAVESVARRGRRDFSTILRDLVSLSLYAAITMIVLAADFQVNVYSLVASVGVLGVVIGFAVQETLGQIFSGLALQLQKPFEPGEWIRTGAYLGRVQGIGVRSTTILTRANERLEVPNSAIAKEVLINYGNPPIADEVSLGISYGEPPNRVRDTILKALRDVPYLLIDPEPEVFAWEYGDSSIKYRIKYWLADYAHQDGARSAVITTLWYTLRRHAMEIPYPIHTLHMQRAQLVPSKLSEFEQEIIRELRNVDFLQNLTDQELKLLVPNVHVHQFGAGEALMREGEQGDTLYVIRRGYVDVLGTAKDGRQTHLATVGPTKFIGERGFLIAEPRGATCRAKTDVEVIEMNREAFSELFKQHPEAVSQISEIIAARDTENRELLAVGTGTDGRTARRNWFISRIREIFDV